jgi:hypothetical protein
LVKSTTSKVIEITALAVQDFYQCSELPDVLVSMRTPYKVHLNFPTVITTELLAHMCRDKVVSKCKEELVDSCLDWERIIDFPHGSFRMLGSRKTKHMDFDPEWVKDKAYYPVTWDSDAEAWYPCGIHYKLLCQLSIFPDPHQLREFERSSFFREMTYMAADAYKAKIEERRRRKQERRESVQSQNL